MNWLADFNQFCMDATVGHDEELFSFGDLDLIYRVTVGLKLPNLSQKMIVCMLSHEPLAGMLPSLHVYIIGTGSIPDYNLVNFT